MREAGITPYHKMSFANFLTNVRPVGGNLNLFYSTNRSSTISSGHHLRSELGIIFEL